ncbi:uncharacterized protein LOC143844041 [Paroedura picta]|uniref:uncharacterized protein LOC143844041 n=1 Tax=Paroedura picta TaxID=143630 RepID=UPI004057ACCE
MASFSPTLVRPYWAHGRPLGAAATRQLDPAAREPNRLGIVRLGPFANVCLMPETPLRTGKSCFPVGALRRGQGGQDNDERREFREPQSTGLAEGAALPSSERSTIGPQSSWAVSYRHGQEGPPGQAEAGGEPNAGGRGRRCARAFNTTSRHRFKHGGGAPRDGSCRPSPPRQSRRVPPPGRQAGRQAGPCPGRDPLPASANEAPSAAASARLPSLGETRPRGRARGGGGRAEPSRAEARRRASQPLSEPGRASPLPASVACRPAALGAPSARERPLASLPPPPSGVCLRVSVCAEEDRRDCAATARAPSPANLALGGSGAGREPRAEEFAHTAPLPPPPPRIAPADLPLAKQRTPFLPGARWPRRSPLRGRAGGVKWRSLAGGKTGGDENCWTGKAWRAGSRETA